MKGKKEYKEKNNHPSVSTMVTGCPPLHLPLFTPMILSYSFTHLPSSTPLPTPLFLLPPSLPPSLPHQFRIRQVILVFAHHPYPRLTISATQKADLSMVCVGEHTVTFKYGDGIIAMHIYTHYSYIINFDVHS